MLAEKERIQCLTEKSVTTAFIAAADGMSLTGYRLARIVGVSAASVSRMRKGGFRLARDSKPFELALLLIRIHSALSQILSQDRPAMADWLGRENASLGAPPGDLLTDVQGLVRVLDYLETRAKDI